MRHLFYVIAALLLAACAAQPQANISPPVTAQTEPVWPFETSDLPFDENFRVGQLDNGLRYVIRQNATPPGTGQVRFLVNAGSTSETESELGFAHYVEHMAFNGSTNVPEGEMVKLLEREGLAFGADTNASTSFDTTLYMLDLPRNDPELLDIAVMIMRETASELLFEPEAVERERGVILAERRVRDTYNLKNVVDRLSFFYPDAHFVSRMPIGVIETLQAADADALRAFYDRTYTPDNSALVIVGDFDPALVEETVRKYFASWSAPAATPAPDPGPVDPDLQGLTNIYIDPALSERVTVARNGLWIDRPDNIATRQGNILRQIGYGIVNRRFQRLANSENPPFLGAGFGTSNVFKVGRTTNLIVDTTTGEWRRGLLAAVAEYRRALEFGFTEAEIQEQLANIRTGLENTVATSATRHNSTFTNAAISMLQDDFVPTTPETSLERFEAFVPSITPEAVLAALNEEAIPLEEPLVRFEGRSPPAEEGVESEIALRTAWNEAAAAPVQPMEDVAAGSFAYDDFGDPGAVIFDTVDDRMGIRTIRFENGLMLNLKRTDLRHDRIEFQLNIDGGDMLNTRDNPLAVAMVSALPLGGLGHHSFDELRTILAGRSVDFSISSTAETFRMGGTTTPRDLELQLQLLAAGITDPAYRSQGEERYRSSIVNSFARRAATPANALANAVGGILSDNDPRFTLQAEEDYLALSFEMLRNAISDRLARGAMELALVGDIDEEQAIALVARSLGALPIRESDFQPYAENRERPFTSDRSQRIITHTGDDDQVLLRFTWLTRDDADPQESAALTLLERLVRLEVTDELRERLGQTYSPSVSASQSRVFPGYGVLSISASLDTNQVNVARDAMIRTITSLRSASADEDLMLRARRPVLESYENLLKSNSGWMGLVNRAQTQPDRIDRYLAGRDMIESVTAEELRILAERYLDLEKAVEIVVLPEVLIPPQN